MFWGNKISTRIEMFLKKITCCQKQLCQEKNVKVFFASLFNLWGDLRSNSQKTCENVMFKFCIVIESQYFIQKSSLEQWEKKINNLTKSWLYMIRIKNYIEMKFIFSESNKDSIRFLSHLLTNFILFHFY